MSYAAALVLRATRLWLAVALLLLSSHEAYADPLKDFKTDDRLLISPYSKKFLSSLRPISWPLPDVSQQHLSEEIHRWTLESQRRPFPKDIHIHWDFYESALTPSLFSLQGAESFVDQSVGRSVFLMTMMAPDGAMIGFMAVTLFANLGGTREGLIEYIVSPYGRGIGASALQFLRGRFASLLNVSRFYLEAEWQGREYWARPEFNLSFSPLQPLVIDKGREIPYSTHINRSFSRFLESHQIDINDLIIEGSNEDRPFSLSENLTPMLLRYVKRKDRRKVLVETLQSPRKVQVRLLDVGIAFLLANHEVNPERMLDTGQSAFLMFDGKSVSDSAMAPWYGIVQPLCASIFE